MKIHTALWALILTVFGITFFSHTAFADALDQDLEDVWSRRAVPAHMGTQTFTTARRFELGLGFGYIPNDDYRNIFPIALDVHYRFTQMWGLMARGSLLMLSTGSKLQQFIDDHQTTLPVDYLGDEQRGCFSLLATFHPVYGKSVASTTGLGHFDWGIFAGLGVVVSNSVNADRTQRSLSPHAQGVFGTDFHVFLLDWLALRFEASLRFYKAPTQWVVPANLSLGVSFLLPEL